MTPAIVDILTTSKDTNIVSQTSIGDLLKTQTTEVPAGGDPSSAGHQEAPNPFAPFFFVAIIIGAFYLLIVRPQKKKQKEIADKVSQVKKDDKVVTIGGIHGVVDKVENATVVIKVDDKTKITFSKAAISDVVSGEPTKTYEK